jgi:DNA repair photolyase
MGLVSKEVDGEKKMIPELLQSLSLQFVWFEIVSDDCNESCIHCYAECMLPTYRKVMGISGEENKNSDIKQKKMKKSRLRDGSN